MEHLKRDASGGWQFDPYFAYLGTIQEQLSESAYAFASTWTHYSLDSPSSLHDAWLEELVVTEASSGARSEIRRTKLTLRFLGPQHDRHLVLHYSDVIDYRVDGKGVSKGHGDLIVHEVSVSPDGHVVHELLFDSETSMLIKCGDLRFAEESRPASDTGTA